MAQLADRISVVGRFARSANLERDAEHSEPLEGYVVTARAVDVIERVATKAATGSSGGAWTLTGPYGSGKSSLALLLGATLGPDSPTRRIAWRLLADASPEVESKIRQAHSIHRTQKRGFHCGLVTASREPLRQTVLRALRSAVNRRYGTVTTDISRQAPKAVRILSRETTSEDVHRKRPSLAVVVEVAKHLAMDAPLLLIIDEFGKNLEAIRDGDDSDPYLLQQIAEAGQGAGLPIFVLTLQHLSFQDYLSSINGPSRREWAKVQGRFEDVPYVESPSQIRALIGTVFEISDQELRNRIRRWSSSLATRMRSLGVHDLSDREVVGSCYPLHPLAAMVLPELCSRYGQHERTLFSFLAGQAPASAASFLRRTDIPKRGYLPSLGLAEVYDYFVANGTSAVLSASESSRWTEIATRLRDIQGLTPCQDQLAKSIALLNLVSTGGAVRASRQVLDLIDKDAGKNLAVLQSRGVTTYRDFADEYRVWQGTDVDLSLRLDIARRQLQSQPLVEILSQVVPPSPVVAARHSAEHDVLRVFSRRYVEGGEEVEPLDAFSPFDGEVLLVVGSGRVMPRTTQELSGTETKPVIAAIPDNVSAFDKAAREVAALASILDDSVVRADWVARREMGERLAEANSALEHATSRSFDPTACRWFLLGASGNEDLPTGRGSFALSAAADRAYSSTPRIHNEMLNRTAPTSQGAKARRMLLEAMISHGSELNLGLQGYGPEMAMYRAFLHETGLHGPVSRDGTAAYCKPTDASLQPAWEVVEGKFKLAKKHRINLNDVYAALLAPPIGMKAAVIPVFIMATMLVYKEEIAIYEHGTFKPLITPDVAERIVRNPNHFEIKHYASSTGIRQQVIGVLAKHLDVRPRFRKHRVSNVLSIVSHLVSIVRSLDNYTLQTKSLRPQTVKVREALQAAVEPDQLIFHTLPRALGFPPIPPEMECYESAHPYSQAVRLASDELVECHDRLLGRLNRFLLDLGTQSSRDEITHQAAALEQKVLDPSIRPFIIALANDGAGSNVDWIKAIATVITKKAPTEWADDDVLRFQQELQHHFATFQRLVSLYAGDLGNGRQDLDALRLVLTSPDGREHVSIVRVEQNQREIICAALDEVLVNLSHHIGPRTRIHESILALIGERLMDHQIDLDSNTARDVTIGKEEHA